MEENKRFDDFKKAAGKMADEFRNIKNTKPIRIISHLDADGISAASIIVKTLERLNFAYSVTILHQLKDEIAKDLAQEDFEVFFFCDLGSGQLKALNKYFDKKKVWLLAGAKLSTLEVESNRRHWYRQYEDCPE